MIRKAVIMAAGKGTRMLPLTKTTPKVLIEIDGRPFLYYVIENLKKARFTEFGIVAGYLKEKIREFIRSEDIDAEIIEQEEQLGTGHAIMQAKSFCKEEQFIVLGGDNLFSVEDLKNINKEDEFCYAVGRELYKDLEKYGVFVIKGDILKKIEEKPKDPPSNIINIGLYKLTPEIWPALDSIEKSPRGEYELTDAMNLLSKKEKVKALKLKGYWIDLGCKEDIPVAEKFIRSSL